MQSMHLSCLPDVEQDAMVHHAGQICPFLPFCVSNVLILHVCHPLRDTVQMEIVVAAAGTWMFQ